MEELNRSVERLSLESVEKRNANIKKREMELKKEEGFTFKPAIKPTDDHKALVEHDQTKSQKEILGKVT